ncbi:MAG: hypothetical protein IT381_27410 [Deltaproteobacteria bacterium]|nr:hypothetical protein [Deltaproteobacteria bacterium]
MVPIIGAGSRPTPQLILAQTIPGGYDAGRAQQLIQQLEQAQASGDTGRMNSIRDGFERAARVRPASGTAIPQTGATTQGVAPEGGTTSPTQSLENLNETTRTRVESAHAPNPETPPPVPGPQQLSFAFGDSNYTPAKGLKTNDAQPVAGARLGTGAVSTQPPQAEPQGPYVSLENSPARIAQREASMLQAQGHRLDAGQTWDSWTKDRTKAIGDDFRAQGGVWQMNPDLLAREAAGRAERAGIRMTAPQIQSLEIEIHNHLVQNGGLLRTGGQLGMFTADQSHPQRMMGFGASNLGGSIIGGIAGSGLGTLAGMVVGGPIGALAGGALGGGLGSLLGSVMGRPTMVNPALHAYPSMAMNPSMMGTGGLLGTLGGGMGIMGGMGMMAGALTGGPMGALNAAGAFQSMQHEFAYAGMAMDNKVRGMMRKNAILQNDMEMMAMINNPNIPIEKLVAMWALKQCKRHEEELKDKMAKAEFARQVEKAEENAKEKRQGMQGMGSSLGSGLGSIVGGIGGFLVGGPIGGMIGGSLGGSLGGSGGGMLASAFSGGQGSILGGANGPGGPGQTQSATALNLEVQMAMEEWKRGIELASNIMKALHDMQMTIINNTR